MTTTISANDRSDSQPATADRPLRLMGTRPVPDLTSYDDVPWFRKSEFILFPLLMPLLIVMAVTGDVFFGATRTTKKYSDARVWRYTVVSKAFFVAVDVIFIATLTSLLV